MWVMWFGVLVLAASTIADDGGTFAETGECPCNGDYNATMMACPYPCPRTCNNLKSLQACIKACPEFGCQCNPGYVLSPRGKCILQRDCPAKCPRNAVYKRCPSPCQPTCDNPSGPSSCAGACVEYGCECKPGYVLTPKGKCIQLNKCPAARFCSRNETYSACRIGCPSEFCPINDERARVACALAYPCPPGCVCKPNHRRLSPDNNKCILASDCPPVKCKRPNEVWNSCPPNCLADRCDDIGKNQTRCPQPQYCDPQCVCKPGFYRNDKDICVSAAECRKCPTNAVYKKCPSPCPGTCENPSGDRPCTKACREYGCECKPGYVMSNGKCIALNKCPATKSCSRNETFAACKVNCPTDFCPVNDGRAKIACSIAFPCPPGCVCKANHRRLSRENNKCILASDCPPVKCKRPNEVWNSCPPNCLSDRCGDLGKNQTRCPQPQYCNPQCVCKPGFYRNDSEICVPVSECRKCPPNAIYKKSPSPCPGTCEYPSGEYPCNKAGLEYGCECKPGYVLSDGKCILFKECPGAKLCKKNETFAACKAECPNNFCPKEDIRGIIACDPPYPCKSGCICQANYRRLSQTNDTCILASECPPLKCKRSNEEWNRCQSKCLPKTCDDINNNRTECKPVRYCEPKCVCKQGFYENSNRDCVTIGNCEKKCPVQPECRPTCAVPNPPNCTYIEPPAKNDNGCQCQAGYVLSKADGECIKIADCPIDIGCNGDPNAVVKQCPQACPSTCDAPNATPCKRKCDPIGCECAPGYLLSKISGKCIRPEKCEGGNPCGENEMFVQCRSDCQYDYCPVDDSLKPVTCEYPPSVPCYSGCSCKLNHKRESRANPTCIVSSDCPPVNCTRRDEVWNTCPSDCLSGYCDSVDYVDFPCNTLLLNCQPRCTCKKNYFRNASDVCISAAECRKINSQSSETTPAPTKCGYNEVPSNCKITCPPQTCESIYTSYQCPNATCVSGCNCLNEHLRNASGICVPSNECFIPQACPISSECRPTCAVPNPPNCPVNKPSATNENGCQCKPGYILADSQGECIEIEKCPSNLGCNGDPHASIKKCPWPCPSTCIAPNTVQCRKACQDVGCQCEPGYLLSKLNGKCILPDECPNGNPCGENGIFSDCGFKCPNQYCPEDDSLLKYACKPGRPCPPGCLCKDNYKWKSYEEETCVLAKDCPPVNCTRSNEVWKRCPKLVEYCRDIDNSVISDPPENEFQAKCACIDGYYRDDNDDCIPKKECKKNTSTRK